MCDKQIPKFYKKVIWSRETIEQHCVDTGRYLQNFIDQFKFNDFWAENNQMYVDILYNDIVSSLVSCSDLHVNTVVQRDLRWSKYLDELKKYSRFALKAWRENGYPICNGFVYDEFKRGRRKYKKAIKDVNCNNKHACASRL